jgi:hypothetical protein
MVKMIVLAFSMFLLNLACGSDTSHANPVAGAAGMAGASNGAAGAGGASGAANAGAGGVGGGEADGGGVCSLVPGGPNFLFHLHNASRAMLNVTLGCSASLPIVLDTPDGQLSIGPGAVDACEYTCDLVYKGMFSPELCTDCGGGYAKALAPGATVDIAWDRRVYVKHMVVPPCATRAGTCALGVAVATSSAQKGTLTVCTKTDLPGYCLERDRKAVPFTIDTTPKEGTIEVM